MLLIILGEFPADPQNLKNCECRSRCHETHYSAKLSAVKFPSRLYVKYQNYTQGKVKNISFKKVLNLALNLNKDYHVCV